MGATELTDISVFTNGISRKKLQEKLKEISGISIDDLLPDRSRVQGHDIRHIQLFLDLFRQAVKVRIDTLPKNQVDALQTYTERAAELIERVKSSWPKGEISGPAWHQLITDISNSYGTIYEGIGPIISYSLITSEEYKHWQDETQKTLDDLKAQAVNQAKQFEVKLEDELKKVTALRNRISDIVEKTKRAAQEVGVVQHTIHFKQQADEHEKSAKRWLWVTAILGVASLVFAVASLFLYSAELPTWSTSQGVQLALSKLVIFSVLFYGLIGSARIYRSHRHNYVVNKHRQNALSTFEAFAKAATDDQTKSAVLLQTTQCIFSPQHSGFISGDSDAGGYPPILEIVREVTASQNK